MKSFFLITLLSLITLSTRAQQTLGITDIRDSIIRNHPALKMLDAEARSMDEAAKGAYSWMPPELGAGFYQTPYDPGRWKYMNGQPGMGSFMISAQQMFPNRKKQDAEFNYKKAASSVEIQKKDVVVNDLLFTARKNYYEWIVILKKAAILRDNANLLKFMMQSAEIRYKNGLGKISAYYKVKAALAQTENDQAELQSLIVEKQIILNTIMNRSPDHPFQVDTNYQLLDFSNNMFSRDSLAARRSDINVIGKSKELNRLQKEAELAKLKPEFGVQFNHMTGWARQPVMFSLMAMVKLPLAKWSSRANKAKAESLVWENEALTNQQAMILNEARGMAHQSLTGFNLKKKQMNLYSAQIIPALKNNFRTMQLAYEQNTEELFQLFDAWEALNTAQMAYLDELLQALELQAELLKIAEMN